MENSINIKGLDKAKVLACLYNNSRQLGMGFLHQRGASGMSAEEAREELKTNPGYFDYLHGRVMKVDITKDEFNPRLYDRDNGAGAAERAISSIR